MAGNGKLRNMKNRSFEVLFHKQIRNIRSKRCPDRASGHTIGWRPKSMIRTTYPDRISYRPSVMFMSVVCFSLRESGQHGGACPFGESGWSCAGQQCALRVIRERGPYTLHTQTVPPYDIAPSTRGNPDGVDPDSLARSVSSGGGVPTPCTRRRSPLPHSSFDPGRNSVRQHSTFSGSSNPDISHPDGRGGHFNFSGQTYPDPLIALTRRVFLSVYSAAEFSCSFLIFPTDILRYFALNICCLNPQSLLVTHLSQDSLVFK